MYTKSTTGLVFLHSSNFSRGRGPRSAGWTLQGDPGNPAGPARSGPTPTPAVLSRSLLLPLAWPSVLCVGYSGTLRRRSRARQAWEQSYLGRWSSQLQHCWAGVPRDVRRSGKTPMFCVVVAHRTKATGSFFSLAYDSACPRQ